MTRGQNPFLSLVIVVVAFGLWALLVATAPQNLFGFWPGLLVGIIGCTGWRMLRPLPTLCQARRRVLLAGVFMVAGLALALSPQRDIPTAAPFGGLVSLTITFAMDRRRLA
ncbi:hypothetical protein [Dyella sp. ASV21]|uniref:hypothetical protein n=1 Tax=Dyella sp. ASV21 TaxID=2795114 RepID=UPI0018ED6C89|nr:hypothetical protein [Dyella sp. ASV21]